MRSQTTRRTIITLLFSAVLLAGGLLAAHSLTGTRITIDIDEQPSAAQAQSAGGEDDGVNEGGIDDGVPVGEEDEAALRREAMRELGRNDPETADPSILSELADGLLDEDAEVRAGAAMVIARIGAHPDSRGSGLYDLLVADTTIRTRLESTIDDDDQQVRIAAVGALMEVYAPEPTIEALLTQRYEVETARDVRTAIVVALGTHLYTSNDTEDVFLDAIEDYDPQLVAMAQSYLDQLYVLRNLQP